MSRLVRIQPAAAVLLALLATIAMKAHAGPVSLGERIEDFTLADARGKPHSLRDQEGPVVVVFLGTQCPLANAYALRVERLAAKWRPKGAGFLVLMSNKQDSLAEIEAFARKHSFSIPVLKDVGNKIADRLGAERTPEAFVLDRDRVVRYRGRIDDQFGVGYQRPSATRADLELALEQVLAGKSVEVPRTEAVGCIIGRVKPPSPSGDVTFHRDVARLLQKRCVECHHDGQVAPFALTDYDEVVGWAEMIREVVSEGRMPPWLASPAHGRFKNDPTLSKAEKQLLFRWIDAGCPEGDPADAPPPVAFAEGWTMSEPDQVFYMSEKPYKVPAEGTVQYQYYVVDPGFTEDRWIAEAEVRAGNPAVVHHVIVFIQRGGGMKFGQPQMAYAPGMPPRKFPQGHAIRVPAGAKLIFQVHYTPNGVAQEDRSYVGFKYADPKSVTHEVIGGAAGVMAFVIPPGDPNFRMVAWRKMREDTILIGMNPHMHVRGKSFRYEAKYPDGRQEILLDVPKYDFNWQLWYNLAEPKLLPKGTELRCTAHFDNSPENPANPNPNRAVTWGEQTWDEMMFGFYSIVEPVRAGRPAAAADESSGE